MAVDRNNNSLAAAAGRGGGGAFFVRALPTCMYAYPQDTFAPNECASARGLRLLNRQELCVLDSLGKSTDLLGELIGEC